MDANILCTMFCWILADSGANASDVFGAGTSSLLDGSVFQYIMDLSNSFFTAAGNGKFGLGNYAKYASGLAGIFCLIYYVNKGYGFITGDKWEIMPLLKPFALSMVIWSWPFFISLVNIPINQLTGSAKATMGQTQMAANKEVAEKWAKTQELLSKLDERWYIMSTAKDTFEDTQESGATSNALSPEEYEEVRGQLVTAFGWMEKIILHGFDDILEKIAMCAFTFACILIVMLKVIFGSILYCVGPLAFAASILPAFKNSWSTWLARYISVQMFTFFLFLSLTIIYDVIRWAAVRQYQECQEMINICEADPNGKWEEVFAYISCMGGHSLMYIACIFMGAGAAMYVPAVSTWIIESGGTAQATNGAIGGAGAAAMLTTTGVRALNGMASSIKGSN